MRIARALSLALLVLFIVACGTTQSQIVRDSYRALTIGANVYDTGMASVAKLYNNGVVGDDVKAEAIRLGNLYHDAYHAAVEALALYAETEGKEGDIQTKLLLVGQQLGKFMAYLNPILVENGMEEIK